MFGSYYPVSGFGAGAADAAAAYAAQMAAARGAAMGRSIAAAQAARALQAAQARQAAAVAAASAVRASQASRQAAAQLMAASGRPASAGLIMQSATPAGSRFVPIPALPGSGWTPVAAAAPQLVTPVPSAWYQVPALPGMTQVPVPASTYKPVLAAVHGFGAAGLAFDAAGIWNDWVAGSAPTNDNAAGKRAAEAIQAALAQLGYTDSTNKPLVVDGSWGAKSGAAYQKFSAAQGTTTNGIYPTQDGIMKIGDLLNAVAGGAPPPGPGPTVTYSQEGGVYVPVATGVKKAGLSTGVLVGVGAAAAIILGGLVLAGKKKPAHHSPAPMHANRRRHRR